ncbi:acetate/propionate family kinase [Actinopolymorpha rutila]|uniref:Acetate kinase n=1 Tax=Actinopolymorpha rutila TaxID=446787 RepID=A0A852ZQU2_9ACTN|nr:acetate/propionate family kinase [Actinopolymorpha rutila]NYH90916.1 acetate kinase [Actinopolymorpha rutila]
MTVNAGSSSLHLVYVDGSATGDRLDLFEPPESSGVLGLVDAFVADQKAPDAVGHRLVHGGDEVRRARVVDDLLRAQLDIVADRAPLHVPPALMLLDRLRQRLPGVPHVVCPDSAFHSGLPAAAATYPLPARWRSRWGLRRYGFHGLSYSWATRRAAQLIGQDVTGLQMVLCHLGGGASVCAVDGGRSVDTSMGFTPLDGLPMSSRSGAIDPGMLIWLLGGRLSLEELAQGLYRESGLLGLSGGRSGDTRELVAAAHHDDAATLALEVYVHRVRREIAAAASSLSRLDALVFTGEVGWDQPEIRLAVCRGLRQLGVPAPVRGNRDDDGPVGPAGAAVSVLVIEPREDLQIATDAAAALP